MRNFRWLVPLVKLYAAAMLLIAAALSPPFLSVIPVLVAAGILFLWWRPVSATINLLADYFAFFSIIVLLTSYIDVDLSLLAGLPVLTLITRDLETAGADVDYARTRRARYLTRLGVALPSIAALALVASLLIGPYLPLLFSGLSATVYFGILIIVARFKIPDKPAQESEIILRMVVGAHWVQSVNLTSKTAFAGRLHLESPCEWIQLNPQTLSFRDTPLKFEISLSPPLSGPATIVLACFAVDRWGLTQTRFETTPVRLQVIPRARYAIWLARRYLSTTAHGSLPLISTVSSSKPLYGYRRGVEYYGSRLYQVGDSLKDIDWKHTAKYGKLVTKEFVEFHGQPAILLINLTTGDAEEGDKQAYSIVMTALSLAREQVPGAVAVYDEKEVRLVTATLEPRILVSRCLEITGQIVATGKPTRYLKPADANRLRLNLRRLRNFEDGPVQKLAHIMQIEYSNLKNRARASSATEALARVYRKADARSTVVAITRLNHDAEAIMFAKIDCENKGKSMLVIS